jgi:4-amino-4-deoxy-L-arabinose transferase-like glycosyltransferase
MSSHPALPRRVGAFVTADRIALALIVALSAFLELVALDREGWSNPYYAAGVRSMLAGPSTFFFGAFDPGGFITLDKPPLGFWIEALSAWLFGYSGVSLLLPGALAAVASVWLLARLVGRRFGRLAGLVAALVLAVTPISVATARNDTVDSLLVLVVLAAVASTLRWGDTGRARWLVLTGVLVGVGFNVKMLEAYLVLPALGLAVLVDQRWPIRRRLGHLAVAVIPLLGVSFAWALIVDAIPAGSRPFVGGSAANSVIDLALNYNGLARLVGGQTFPNLGRAGPLRLFDPSLSGQIGWWLVLGVVGLIVAAVELHRRPARRRFMVPLALWAGWFATTAVFFSVANFWHPHYLVMLAPAGAALAGAASAALLRAWRRPGPSGWLLPIAVAGSGVIQVLIVGLASGFDWLQGTVLVLSLALGGGLLLVRAGVGTIQRDRAAGLGLVVAAVLALAIAPLGWSAWTTFHPPGASLPIGGPPAANGGGRGGGAFLGLPGGGPTGAPAGFGRAAAADSALIAFALEHQHDARFVLATASAQEAAPIIIATGLPVMSLGGFSGSDRTLTVAAFEARVVVGDVRYVLVGAFGGGAGSGGAGGGGFGGRNEVISWAQNVCAPITTGVLAGQIVDCQSRSSNSRTDPNASIEPRVIGSSTSWTAPMPARA